MKYAIVVGGVIYTTTDNLKEARNILNNLRQSPLGWVHPTEAMYIKEV